MESNPRQAVKNKNTASVKNRDTTLPHASHLAGTQAPETGNEGTSAPRRETRLFLRLVIGVSLVVCLLAALLWLIPVLGFSRMHQFLPVLTGIVCAALIVGVAGSALSLILHSRAGSASGSSRVRGMAIRLFLPLAELLGRILGRSVEEVRRSFITVNNDLVARSLTSVPADQILILLPHCLQASMCPRRLTHDPDNCVRCGGCVQGGLLDLRDRWGVRLAVATGGTIARRIVKEMRPRLIVAVACERDLASGIQDTFPLPVYGVLNQRPCGPCLDTTVDLTALEAALRRFASAPEPSTATATSASAPRGEAAV